MASYQSVWCGYFPNMIPYITGQPFGYPYYSQNLSQPVFYSCQTGTNLTTGCNTVQDSRSQLSMNIPTYCCPPVTNQYPYQPACPPITNQYPDQPACTPITNQYQHQPAHLPNPPTRSLPQFNVHSMLTVPHHETHFRHKLNNESGCHRVLIQGSKINYVCQNNLSTSDQHINWSQIKAEDQPTFGTISVESDCTFVNKNSGLHVTPVQPEHYGKKQKLTTDSNKTDKADFTNLDLLSSVSLLETSRSPTETTEKSANKLFKGKEFSDSLSVIEESNPPISVKSLLSASALGLVPFCLIRKPTVWLNVTLQVDTSSGVKSGQTTAQYRSLMTNILTELYFPPKLSPPDHLHSDKMAATASYDERGRLTVLEVEFITAGIYKVENTSDRKSGQEKSTRKSVTLTRLESLENLTSKSQYFILGDLCPVPETFLKCHRSAHPLQKKISEYLYSREFKKHTLPLLLKNGEEDVWTTSLKVPRTRSRVSDYDDLANGDQSLKRKYSNQTLLPRKDRKLIKASSASSVCSSSPDRSDESAVNSPCPSPSSVSSLSSYHLSDMYCEDSCDSLSSIQSEPPVLVKEKTVEIDAAAVISSPPRLKPVTKFLLTKSKRQRTSKTSNKL